MMILALVGEVEGLVLGSDYGATYKTPTHPKQFADLLPFPHAKYQNLPIVFAMCRVTPISG